MAELIVSGVAKRLSRLLIDEVLALTAVESRVEDIRRELMQMEAFLKHMKDIESRRAQKMTREGIKLMADLNDVARKAEDVIENFLVSDRMPWIFSFVKRCKVAKEVERIDERVRELSHRVKYVQSHQTDKDVADECLPGTSQDAASPNAERISEQTINISQRRMKYDQSDQIKNMNAVETLSYILSENLVANFEVKKVVEEVRDEVASMVSVVSDLKSKYQSSERQNVWRKEVNTVCNFTVSVIEDFKTRRKGERFPKGVLMCLPSLHDQPRPSERKLMKEMKYIRTQVRVALIRRLTYGVGEEDVDDQIGWTYGVDAAYLIESIPTFQIAPSLAKYDPFVVLIKYEIALLQSVGFMRRSMDQKMGSIQRELALMHAFFGDIRGVGGLNKRQKVWVDQTRQVAQQAEALLDAYNELRRNSGGFKKLFQGIVEPLLQFDDTIDYILYKMCNNWERKTIYDIANTEGRKGGERKKIIYDIANTEGRKGSERKIIYDIASKEGKKGIVSSGQSMQGSGSKTHTVVEHNDDSGTEEDPLLPGGMSTNNRLNKDPIEQVVESIREDMELMKALFHDAQKIGELDRKSKIWVQLMKDIYLEMESVSNEYASKFEDKPIHTHILNFPRLYTIQSKINQIRYNIQEASRIKKRYGLIHLQTRAEPASLVQRLHRRTRPPLHERDSNITGFDEDVEVLMRELPLHMMRCLYYFVLFPAEFEIPTRRLIALWVAEDRVHHGPDQEPPEEVAEGYLAKLIDLNLVQIAGKKRNGKVKTCRLPNALRQSPFLQRHTSTNPDSVSKKPIIRQVADHLDINDFYYNHIHSDTVTTSAAMKSLYKDVLSFLSFDTREGGKPGEDIGKFLDRCISGGCFLQLRVLDLERVYKPQLLDFFASLSQLRYLGLRWTYLESLPSSISRLLELQTLDLKHTYISILPSSIWKMQMRHLFLSETYRTRFPPHPKGNSLSNLQTLWGLFVDEKTPVKGGLDRLGNIRKLGLACQSMSQDENEMTKQLQAVAEWIMNIKYLQSLRLKSRKEDGKPGDLHLGSLEKLADLTDMYLSGILISLSIEQCPSKEPVFPPSLIELTLSHSKLRQDSIEVLGDLPNLQLLSLLAGSYIDETLHCKKGSFPQLYFLEFWNLTKLKEWNIAEEAFPHLRQLEIRSCECLLMLPDGLRHISTLRELKLTTMTENFMERVTCDDRHKIPISCNVLHCYFNAEEQQFSCNSVF